jgi:hypothetical protein
MSLKRTLSADDAADLVVAGGPLPETPVSWYTLDGEDPDHPFYVLEYFLRVSWRNKPANIERYGTLLNGDNCEQVINHIKENVNEDVIKLYEKGNLYNFEKYVAISFAATNITVMGCSQFMFASS